MSEVSVSPTRDPFVDRARSAYLYAVAVIALVQGVVLPIAGICGRPVEYMSLSQAAWLMAPAIAFMFGKSFEQVFKAWKVVRP